MTNRWPQLPQTTVSINVVEMLGSAVARRRLATPLSLTSVALDSGEDRRARRRGTRSAASGASLH
jgi:hypothetical protein